jgi:hypothetical protein
MSTFPPPPGPQSTVVVTVGGDVGVVVGVLVEVGVGVLVGVGVSL